MTNKVDLRNNSLGVLPVSTKTNNLVLTANVAKSISNPSQFGNYAVIGCDKFGLFVKANGNAVVPSADVTDGTGQMIDPVIINVAGLTSLSFVCASAAIVSVSFYN